jgi:hypothetical protein
MNFTGNAAIDGMVWAMDTVYRKQHTASLRQSKQGDIMQTETTKPTIDLDKIVIRHGSHGTSQPRSEDAQACVMEWVCILAGEERVTDHPACACPVISAFMIRWNDRLPDDQTRTRLLRPLIPHLLNTRSTRAIERKRGYMAADWGVREQSPRLLRAMGFAAQADRLSALAPIVDGDSARAARATANEIYNEVAKARDEAYRKMRDAAYADDAADAAAAYADDAADAADAAYASAYAASAADAYAYAADAADAADADAADAADAYAAYAAYAYAASAAYVASAAYAASADLWKRLVEAAKSGGYAAAKKLADKTIGAETKKRLAPVIAEAEASAQDVVRRMCAVVRR